MKDLFTYPFDSGYLLKKQKSLRKEMKNDGVKRIPVKIAVLAGSTANAVCDQLELLPPDIVIERLTGDGIGSDLLAPEWSRKKVTVINDIDKELYRRKSFQGLKYQ